MGKKKRRADDRWVKAHMRRTRADEDDAQIVCSFLFQTQSQTVYASRMGLAGPETNAFCGWGCALDCLICLFTPKQTGSDDLGSYVGVGLRYPGPI